MHAAAVYLRPLSLCNPVGNPPLCFPSCRPEAIVLGNRCGFTLTDPALYVQTVLSRAAPRWPTPNKHGTRSNKGSISLKYKICPYCCAMIVPSVAVPHVLRV
jgi:hypothetical protein